MARIQGELLGDIEAEGSHADVNLVLELVESMKGTGSFRGEVGDVVAVVGKGFSRGNGRSLSDDLVPLHDRGGAIGVGEDPFASEKRDRTVGEVADADEVNEGMEVDALEARFLLVVNQFVQSGL